MPQEQDRIGRIESVLDKLVEVQTAQAKNLETLTAVMASLAVAQAQTEKSMNDLSVKSAETQAKFDALIHRWQERQAPGAPTQNLSRSAN